MTSRSVLAAVLVLCCGEVRAADLSASAGVGPQILFAPTNPVGVASEVPRSPLTDFIVNAPLRFDTRDQAQARCPSDRVVWIRFGSNFYQFAGRPDPDAVGAFMCQGDASTEGDRPLEPEKVSKRR